MNIKRKVDAVKERETQRKIEEENFVNLKNLTFLETLEGFTQDETSYS